MDYKVIWDDEAIAELAKAVRYIARHNPVAARKTGETILKKAALLGAFPHLGKTFPRLNQEDVREFPIPPYRLVYHVKDAELSVRIMNVWHGAREEPDIR
jgi:toxin ParE1/3/4